MQTNVLWINIDIVGNKIVTTYPTGMKTHREYVDANSLAGAVQEAENMGTILTLASQNTQRYEVTFSEQIGNILFCGANGASPQKVVRHEKATSILDPFNNWMRHRFLRNERGGEDSRGGCVG